MTLRARFFSKVTNISDHNACWEWAAFRVNGYGRFWMDGANIYAHRASWLIHNGTIPDNLRVLHRCDNRACVNPAHLFLGTHEDNMRDMVAKGRSASGDRSTARLYLEKQLRGESHPRSKLTAEQVRSIRSLASSGVMFTDIAVLFGVSRSTVSSIHRRISWKSIGGDS
jgi:hypothetical protein